LDLSDREGVAKLFAERHFDLVIHLAAQAGVRYSLSHPHSYIEANITGTLTLLEGCRHHHIPKMIYASSSSVYGLNQQLPFRETEQTDRPAALYGATKKANELMAHSYSHLFGLQTIGLRFFTVYGPWGRPDMAMWLFADAILHDRPIRLFNHGDMYRDFTYIDDIVQGIVACSERELHDRSLIFNLGNHRSEKLMDLVQLLESSIGKTARKEWLPMQPGDVYQTYADIDRATELLGFQPRTPLSEGVPRFVQWFLEHPEYHQPLGD
jgi:UDP-glucuronate 4-epimerase